MLGDQRGWTEIPAPRRGHLTMRAGQVEADRRVLVRSLGARRQWSVALLTGEERVSPSAPIFTRGIAFVCFVTLLSGSAQSLVVTAIPLLLTQMRLAAEFVGLFIGAFSLGALIVRFPAGAAMDGLGWRAFGLGGAGLLGVGCVLYALAPFVPLQIPLTAEVPLLLALAGMAHTVGFSTYGRSARSFVAYTVPAARSGEAVGYYGIGSNVAWGLGAGVSLLFVAAWGFSVLLGTAAVMAALVAVLSLSLHDTPRTADRVSPGKWRRCSGGKPNFSVGI